MVNMKRILAISFITLNKSYLYVLCLGDPKTLTPGPWTPYGPGPLTTLWTGTRTPFTDTPTDHPKNSQIRK